MATQSQQHRWRLGGRNAPPWLQAPCDPEVKKGTREDFALLREIFPAERLAASHPLRRLWELQKDARALSEARFEFHHLAADLRTIHGVAGAPGLLRALISDGEHYADYRYELRIAGSVGRYPGQQLVRLGGKEKGADIEVIANSGHRCGIACYRANSITPSLRQSSWVNEALMQEMGAILATTPVPGLVAVAIEFPRFPIGEEEKRSCMTAFRHFWTKPTKEPITDGGVTVKRLATPPFPAFRGWETRIVLCIPVPAREKQRLADSIRSKLEKEHAQWACQYSGTPFLAVEESDYSLGLDQRPVSSLLSVPSHSFAGAICTTSFFKDNGDNGKYGRICIEDIRWIPREGVGISVNLGMQTYGQNLECYGKDHVVMSFNPSYAEEEWQFRPNYVTGNVDGRRLRLLSLQRVIHRVPAPNGQKPTFEMFERAIRQMLPGRT